jgi:gluconolactonase
MTRIAWLSLCVLLLAPWRAGLAELSVVDADASYPEGPVWRGGKLFFVEYGRGGIKVWDGQRVGEFWRNEHCGPSGLFSYGKDHWLIACYDNNSLVEVDDQGKEVRSIQRDSAGKRFVGPNDFASDGAGGFYFTASGVYDVKAPITGTVVHMSADGRKLVEVADKIHYSNGLVLSKDGKSLLVAEMLAGRILSFPVNADRSLGVRSVWARLQDLAPPTPNADAYNGPDGFKLGSDGNYYIAQNGSGRVLVVTADKQLVRTIDVPAPYVTNIGFGPDGANTVFITASFDQWKAPYPGVVYRWTQ